MYCENCDPLYYIVYGFCESCQRRCHPPLFDIYGNMSILDYEEFRQRWNEQRSDMILDVVRASYNDIKKEKKNDGSS